MADSKQPATTPEADKGGTQPVIVGRRPVIKQTGSENGEAAGPPRLASSGKTIAPLDGAAQTQAAGEPASKLDIPGLAAAGSSSKPKDEAAAKPSKETAAPAQADIKAEAAPAAAREKPAREKPADESQKDAPEDNPVTADEAAAREAAKLDAQAEGLIESEKYFLPINTVERQKSKRFVMLGVGLSLLLLLAWLDIALDASIIHIEGVKPVTHFFSS